MILIRRLKVLSWLDQIEKDQNWLAGELKVGKSYLSQALHNKVKISRRVTDQLLVLSRIPYESLFYVDSSIDQREFYGAKIYFNGQMISSKQYEHEIHQILVENPPKNNNKNGN